MNDSQPRSIPYLKDTDTIPVPLSYTLIEPYVEEMDRTSYWAIKGMMTYQELRRSTRVMPQQKTPAENHYSLLSQEADKLHRWAKGYVEMQLESMSYVDFKRMKESLSSHLKGMEDVVALNDKLSAHIDGPTWSILNSGVEPIMDFYTKFIMEVMNITSNKYLMERVEV